MYHVLHYNILLANKNKLNADIKLYY